MNESLKYLWEEYRKWAYTSRKIKGSISMWRGMLLAAIIGSAIFTILGELVNSEVIKTASKDDVRQVFNIMSALCIGAATLIGRDMLSGKREEKWYKARSLAEAYKSESYLFAIKAQPYNQGDRNKTVIQRIKNLSDKTKKAEQLVPEKMDTSKMPPPDLSYVDYLKNRVENQREGYYLKKVVEYQKKSGRAKFFSTLLGGIGISLSGLAALGGQFSHLAIWVTLVTTISGAVAAFYAASRYQYLILSYRSVADRLKTLQLEPAENQAQKLDLVYRFEQAIITENNGWMTEFMDSVEERERQHS